MSGSNTLAPPWWMGIGQSPQNTLAPQPTWADAMDANARLIAEQRQRDVDAGLIDPTTGWPTTQGHAQNAINMGLGLGTFGGERAATANLSKLADARALEAKGIGRDDILSQTGWFKGPDNQWRFEISDQGMTVNPRTADMTTLGQQVNHPDLFAAYPQMAETQVGMQPGIGGKFYPGFGDGPPTISVGPYKDPRGTFLHEMQHNVQEIEGFEHGGSVTGVTGRPEFQQAVMDRIRKVTTPLSYDEYANAAWGGEKSAESLADYQNSYLKTVPKSVDLYSPLGKTIQESAAQETYRRLFGEVEARSVQDRMRMDPQARLDAGPWWGWDTPESKFIVRSKP